MNELVNEWREKAERRDIEIINRNADQLNAEAEDVLGYQAMPEDALQLGEE